jgi:hypothetical protein
MTNQENSARIAQPQAVVGPITLGQNHGGTAITIEPNSVISLNVLSETLGTSTIALHSVTSTTSGLTIGVEAKGSTQTIEISGQSDDQPATTFAPGTLLKAITRTEDEIILLTSGPSNSHVTFPIGSGVVTATFTASPVI